MYKQKDLSMYCHRPQETADVLDIQREPKILLFNAVSLCIHICQNCFSLIL